MGDRKILRMTYLSVYSADSKQMQETCDMIEKDLGVRIELHGFMKEDCESDPFAYEDLCRCTKNCDFVHLRCMGDPWKFQKFDRYTEVLRSTSAFVCVASGAPEVDIMTKDLCSGTEEDFMNAVKFLAFKCPDNDYRFLWWAAKRLGFVDSDPPEPVSCPPYEIYHTPKDGDGITAGILFVNSQKFYGNMDYIDAIIEHLESMDIRVLAVGGSFDCMRAVGGTREILEKNFTSGGKPLIDVLISLTGYANTNCTDGFAPNTDGESSYRALLDVPIVFGLSVHGNYHDFEDEKVGLGKKDFQSNVIYPELDGNVIAVPVSYTAKDEPKKSIPIPERIDHLCRLTKAWGSLRRKPASERKVAIMMWQSRPNSGVIGAAAGLDTIESVSDLLRRMDSLGYRIENVPECGKDLIDEVLENITNDLDNQSMATVLERSADLVTVPDYRRRYDNIPAWDREMTEHSWGEPPGEIMSHKDRIVIPGLVKGNVFVCYQPMRGWAEQMDQNTHDPLLFTQHQYNAYYWWIKNVFKADMIFHMGTHGTLEWLPGVNVGLSQKCNPDYVLDAVPNIYPYTVNDPGEGMQAKRRSESVLIGHMPPTMARADSFGKMQEIGVLLQDYFKYRGDASQSAKGVMVSQIYEAAKENNLFKDLGIEEDPGAEGFEEYLIPLHEYIMGLEEALVRADLHIIGRPPAEHHFDDMVYSLTRLDNGDIRSLRDAYADYRSVDIQNAIANPTEVGPTGELNSDAVTRIDAEERELISLLRTEFDYDPGKAVKHLEGKYGKVPDDLCTSIEFTCNRVVPNIRLMTYEAEHMMDALDGRFVIPGPSGSPVRGNADILPMGRNFYSLDPDCVPTHTAWEIGRGMADQMIERYVADRGTYPREIGVVIWATDMMTTGGDDAAYVLWLLGVRPVWSKVGGQVVDLEIVPAKELGRPRVDVTLNITGLFRDTFPGTIDLIDDAIKMVANLDESEEENALAANLRRDIVESIAEGLTPDEARIRNSVRIFGEALGTYGNGVGNLIESGKWDETKDLADVYADLSSYGYSKGSFGVPMKKEFVKRFSRVTATIKNAPSREFDILDIDDVWQYLGGMNAFVRAYGQKDFVSYMGDNSDPKKTKIRGTQEELRFLFRSKVTNPKFNNGLMEHGYRGASEMAKITEYTMAWGATSGIAEDWMYDTLVDTYLKDEKVLEWMDDVNPYAVMNILNTLHEAIDRGLWNASDEYREFLKDLFIKTEERIEELTDR